MSFITDASSHLSVLQPSQLPASSSDSPITSLFKESICDYTLSEIWTQEENLQQLRKVEGNTSERYIYLKQLVHEVRMAHLPMRSYMLWKTNQYDFISPFFDEKYPRNKETRKNAKAELQQMTAAPTIQQRLKLLSKLTFIHGTNSSTLVLMLQANEPALVWTGGLISRNTAPMYGELKVGVGIGGVNLRALSTETVRDCQKIIGYTQMAPFNPAIFGGSPFQHLDSREVSWNHTAILILQLKQWDQALFDRAVEPIRLQWLDLIEKEYVEKRTPLIRTKAILEHAFTPEEKAFIQGYWAGVGTSDSEIPVGLRHIFKTIAEIPPNPNDNVPYTLHNDMNKIREGSSYWWPRITWRYLDYKVRNYTGFETSIAAIEKEVRFIESGHQRIVNALNDPAGISLPSDASLRSLITHPIPIIFSSTTVKPQPHSNHTRSPEFLLRTPTKLGRGGCDVLFTDTPESIERIKAILPEALRDEIEFHLFEEMDVGEIPVIHSPDQLAPYMA